MKGLLVMIKLAALALIVFATACDHSNSFKDENERTVVVDTANNTINEGKLEPYREVDSLTQDLKKVYNVNAVLKLDSICSKSDGDLTEKYYDVTQYLFKAHLSYFVSFMLEHPDCCLKNRLIEGISAELSVFDGDERINEISKRKEKTLNRAKDAKLSTQQMQVINDIYNKINPALFD